jgi:hypothetical protein
MAAVMRDLVASGMPAAQARLLGTDGRNGALMIELFGVGFPAAQAKLLGSDTPGAGKTTPMATLMRAGLPSALARRLGV